LSKKKRTEKEEQSSGEKKLTCEKRNFFGWPRFPLGKEDKVWIQSERGGGDTKETSKDDSGKRGRKATTGRGSRVGKKHSIRESRVKEEGGWQRHKVRNDPEADSIIRLLRKGEKKGIPEVETNKIENEGKEEEGGCLKKKKKRFCARPVGGFFGGP